MWNPSHIFNLHHSSWQSQILNLLSGARDWTWVLMGISWVCYRWATKSFSHAGLLWCLIVILICIFPDEVVLLFMCLFGIWIFSFVFCYWVVGFFLLIYRSSLYTWYESFVTGLYCKYLFFSYPFHSYWCIMINGGLILICSKWSILGKEKYG